MIQRIEFNDLTSYGLVYWNMVLLILIQVVVNTIHSTTIFIIVYECRLTEIHLVVHMMNAFYKFEEISECESELISICRKIGQSKSKIRISEETQRFALAIFLEWGAEMTQIPEKPTISVWFGIVDLSEL